MNNGRLALAAVTALRAPLRSLAGATRIGAAGWRADLPDRTVAPLLQEEEALADQVEASTRIASALARSERAERPPVFQIGISAALIASYIPHSRPSVCFIVIN